METCSSPHARLTLRRQPFRLMNGYAHRSLHEEPWPALNSNISRNRRSSCRGGVSPPLGTTQTRHYASRRPARPASPTPAPPFWSIEARATCRIDRSPRRQLDIRP
jgi:hypothetical protein